MFPNLKKFVKTAVESGKSVKDKKKGFLKGKLSKVAEESAAHEKTESADVEKQEDGKGGCGTK